MIQTQAETYDIKALIHILCNLEYTGVPYRGTKMEYAKILDEEIKKYKSRNWHYTPEEDAKILTAKSLVKLADDLGRTPSALYVRKMYLKRQRAQS